MAFEAVYLDGLHFRQELVKCGKPGCKVCRAGPAHGPYWYCYDARGIFLKKRYVGKELPAEVAAAAKVVTQGRCNGRGAGQWRLV